jgi:tRNA threonylcarbamoyladenosine biosynthesis protein TsaE
MDITNSAQGLTLELASEEDTVRLGQAIADLVQPGDVIGLVGPLGAGKTRLARAIAEALGADPMAISSPTFVLIHEYEGRMPIYHFDAYRLKDLSAFEELGAADYWGGGGVCLVEWADRVRALLPTETWMITLTPAGPTSRSVSLELPPSGQGCAARLAECLAARQRTTAPR